MKKLFVFIVKYIPVIQMAGILLNNLIFGLGAYNFAKVLDFIIGNSIAIYSNFVLGINLL